MPDNTVQIRVGADLSAVNAQFGSLNKTAEALSRTIAESMKMAGASATEAAVIYKQLGMASSQAAREIDAAFGGGAGAGGATRAIHSMGAAIPPVTYSMKELTQATDSGLMSNRMSVQLLAQEMGMRLPRSVSSAVAQMIPNINMLSSALLGVFAVREMIAFGREMKDVVDKVNQVKEAEDSMRESVQASDKAMVDLARHSRSYTQLQLVETNARIAALSSEVDQQRDADEGKTQVLAALTPIVLAYHAWAGESEKTKAAEAALNHELALRKELFDALNEGNADRAKQSSRESTAAEALRKKEGQQLTEQLRTVSAIVERSRSAERKGIEDTATQIQMAIQRDFDGRVKLSAQYWQTVNTINLQGELAQGREEKQATDRSMREMDRRASLTLQYQIQSQQRVRASQQEKEANQQAWAGMAAGFAGLIAGRRAAAAVEGAFDAAKAIEMWAAFAASQFTDFPLALAATQYTLASAQMFAVAGSGGGGGGSRGGGGGGTQSSYGRGGGSGSGGSGGAGAAMPGSGSTIHLHLEGPGWTQDSVIQLMAQMSQISKNGQAVLTSTNALYNGEKLG